jgi:signal transduction histidine kinase
MTSEKAECEARERQTLRTVADGIAHAFNNLLTAIVGSANLGSLEVGPDSELAGRFDTIEQAAMRGANLTRQLSAFAGRGIYRMEDLDLNVLVKEFFQVQDPERLLVGPCFQPGQPVLAGQVTLRLDLGGRLPRVRGDAAQVSQVLANLLSNACEAFGGGPGGLVTVRTRAARLAPAAGPEGWWALAPRPGPYVMLEVEDAGSGMAPEVLARAFEPFFSTRFAGRGLGLAAVLGILGCHDGGVRVRSAPGQGSAFAVFLPARGRARAHLSGSISPASAKFTSRRWSSSLPRIPRR